MPTGSNNSGMPAEVFWFEPVTDYWQQWEQRVAEYWRRRGGSATRRR